MSDMAGERVLVVVIELLQMDVGSLGVCTRQGCGSRNAPDRFARDEPDLRAPIPDFRPARRPSHPGTNH